MKKIIFSAFMLSSALLATSDVQRLSEVFSEATTSGNIKYYYIQTDKDNSYTNTTNTSAYANSIGGELRFNTARLYGFSGALTFMTTNPFLLSGAVDTSIIGKDNGAMGGDATKGFSVLGEAYISYMYKNFQATYGRKEIKTPLMSAKEVRMLPSTFNGLYTSYKLNATSKITADYITEFKQRTSSDFINIIEHALGTNTDAVVGKNSDKFMAMASYNYAHEAYGFDIYDCYANDFLNSVYADGAYKFKVSDNKLALNLQYIHQNSIGNADTNLAQAGSITAGKKVVVDAVGVKLNAKVAAASFTLAYSKVASNSSYHDSLVLAWDGTPLFTNMITSNDLFQSIYGGALKADSVYIGGSQGVKIAYAQKYDSLGLKGFSTTLSYLNTSNSRFAKDQNDYNVVLGYKYDKEFSLALKGIWVSDNTSMAADGTITQLKLLSQYRVIANYKF
ncbi:OprD family outer membrane porin [Sulfurimonas sp.]